MTKIPFDIKYRPQIESGAYKVVDRTGEKVRIICWDGPDKGYPIVAFDGEYRMPFTWGRDGRFMSWMESDLDLFLVTPDEEMTDFEAGLFSAFSDGWQQYLNGEEVDMEQWAKEHSAELLSLARKQLQPEIDAEIEKAYKTADEVQYRKGREEALKDLPMWRKATGKVRFDERVIVLVGSNDLFCANYAEEGEYYLPFHILDKLPKEDSYE